MAHDRALQDIPPTTNTMRFDTDMKMKFKDAYASRHEPEAARVLARTYWASIITIFVLVASTSVAYGVWEFFQGSSLDTSANVVRPKASFTKAQLDTILTGFDGRAARFQSRLTAPVPIKDPSQ